MSRTTTTTYLEELTFQLGNLLERARKLEETGGCFDTGWLIDRLEQLDRYVGMLRRQMQGWTGDHR